MGGLSDRGCSVSGRAAQRIQNSEPNRTRCREVLVGTEAANGIQTLSARSSEVSNSECSHIPGGGEWRAKVFHVRHAVNFDSWRANPTAGSIGGRLRCIT
jgi:hypothetical protein